MSVPTFVLAFFLTATLALPGYATTPTDRPLARTAPTQMQDRAVTNHCIDSNRDKTECLCLMLVLKHTLTLSDYNTVATRITPQNTLRFTPANVQNNRVSRPTLDPTLRVVLNRSDFGQLCSEANEWFAKSSADR